VCNVTESVPNLELSESIKTENLDIIAKQCAVALPRSAVASCGKSEVPKSKFDIINK